LRLRLKETNALTRRAREARKQHEREKRIPGRCCFVRGSSSLARCPPRHAETWSRAHQHNTTVIRDRLRNVPSLHTIRRVPTYTLTCPEARDARRKTFQFEGRKNSPGPHTHTLPSINSWPFRDMAIFRYSLNPVRQHISCQG
jgi:hypothetical protein